MKKSEMKFYNKLGEVLSKEKPASLLFILTGLGRYSWYKLPFLKRHTFCGGLPQVLMHYIRSALRYKHGRCKCNTDSCKWISFFGLYIGACKDSIKKIKARTV